MKMNIHIKNLFNYSYELINKNLDYLIEDYLKIITIYIKIKKDKYVLIYGNNMNEIINSIIKETKGSRKRINEYLDKCIKNNTSINEKIKMGRNNYIYLIEPINNKPNLLLFYFMINILNWELPNNLKIISCF